MRSRTMRIAIEAVCALALLSCAMFASRGAVPPANDSPKETVILLVTIVKDGQPVKLFNYLRKEWDSVAACEAEVRADPAFPEAFKRLADSVAPEIGGEFEVQGRCVVKPGAPI